MVLIQTFHDTNGSQKYEKYFDTAESGKEMKNGIDDSLFVHDHAFTHYGETSV